MNNNLHQISTLAGKLCEKLNCAIDTVEAGELITDRAALRNITGALKDLRDLFDEQLNRSAADPPALLVTFEGGTKGMSE